MSIENEHNKNLLNFTILSPILKNLDEPIEITEI